MASQAGSRTNSANLLVGSFVRCGSDGVQDAEAWQILRQLADMRGQNSRVKTLGIHKWFMKAYIGFVMRCCNRLKDEAHTSPKPSQVLRLLPSFGISADQLWIRVLWQVSSGIVESHSGPIARGGRVLYGSAMEELITLWQMCLATHLSRSKGRLSPSPGSSRLDWSFLPDATTFSNMLVQSQPDRTHATFQDSMDLLLPISSSPKSTLWDDKTGFRARNPSDLPSVALVTLDMLHDTTEVDDHHPFVALLAGMMKAVQRPEIPGALQHKLDTIEEDGIRERYAVIAERLSLLHSSKSPVSRNSGTPQRAQGAGAARYPQRASNFQSPQEAVAQAVLHLDEDASSAVDRRDAQDMPVDTMSRAGKVSNIKPGFDSGGMPNGVTELQATASDDATSESLPSYDASIDPDTDFFVELRVKRLGQALARSNLPFAERIKDEVLQFTQSATVPKAQLPDEIYETLMLTLLSLQSPQSAIQVWNHYIELGHQPTAKTYTVMMRGAQHVRDIRGLEAFWDKMRRAGVQPDEHAWSIRVFGLIRSGKVEAGMKALSEMGQEWFSAARNNYAGENGHKHRGKQAAADVPAEILLKKFDGAVDGVPRPTREVVNAAISALASRNDAQISKVIGWGRQFGLEPDRYTYNVILNVAMRHGQGDSAMTILERMQQQGIVADSTTWTVLLTALFEGRSLDELALDQQQSRIITFMSSLETAAAAPIDAKGYALVIDRLLKFYSNRSAANAVLERMTSKGLRPTTQIYTILMSSYFDAQPRPDFAAAETLWSHMQASDAGRGAALDSFFYDRMIEGYATHHREVGAEPMLRFLQSCLDKSKKPSWRALSAVARALAERNDWDRLLRLVDDARRLMGDESEGEFRVGPSKRFGQMDFWNFIIDTGLLEREGITRVEQIMGERDRLSTFERAERRAAMSR